ncbi:MAG: right-handed parallel beta-helix repeat-containing protein [Anaerolineales bacterium]|nr:right-handed parallel beta-helix repeat-containing protein [Anaerolineales bacterium]
MKGMMTNLPRLIVLGIILAGLAVPLAAQADSILTVNTTEDHTDHVCDASDCTLREAIEEANRHSGPDRIRFDIPGAPPYVIRLESPLPNLTDDQTVIEGDSEPDYDDRPVIVLDGSAGIGAGLMLWSDGNAVFGLSLVHFIGGRGSDCQNRMAAIVIRGDDNLIAENYIGVDPSGLIGRNDNGIRIESGRNFVQENVISGNALCEILVRAGDGTSIQGNLIGTDPSGMESRASSYAIGIELQNPMNTLIGGSDPDQRNVISGHRFGILVNPSPTEIIGNYIGTNAAGTAAIPNGIGIGLPRGSSLDGNPLGPRLVSGNVISGNRVGVDGAWEHGGDVIQGNLIGTNAAGTGALPNTEAGILLLDGNSTLIEDNVISGNPVGIRIGDFHPMEGVILLHNRIGTNADGTAAIPNSIGIQVRDSVSTAIGQPDASTAGSYSNLISGNSIGVLVDAGEVAFFQNWIGLDSSSAGALPNEIGIQLDPGVSSAFIGGDGYAGNHIAFNTYYGVFVTGAVESWIMGNEINNNGADGVMLTHEDPESLALGAQITITRNSIYDNGGLGIAVSDPAVNFAIRPPTLSDVGRDHAAGTACPGCRVELFIAEPDPSGAGEGRTFITTINAGTDGVFNVRFPPLASCQQITATATDALGNTSTFSLLADAGLCIGMPPRFALVTFMLVGLGGGLFALLIDVSTSSERKLTWRTGGLVLTGGITGVGLVFVLMKIPVIRVDWPAETEGSNPEVVPPCARFVDMSALAPADGAVFDIGTDVLVELSPQPDPPGSQRRWTLTLTGPGEEQAVLTEMPVRAVLSDIGFNPDEAGLYFWRISAEEMVTGSNLWEPLCRDQAARLFSIQEAEQAPVGETETAEPTATPTPMPTLSPATAVALQNAHCRSGPSTQFEPAAILAQGAAVPVTGRLADDSWWFVLPEGERYGCWVWGGAVDVAGDLENVPVLQSPPTPTPTPLPGCWVWNANLQQDVCTVPCPPNATPGGVCTP